MSDWRDSVRPLRIDVLDELESEDLAQSIIRTIYAMPPDTRGCLRVNSLVQRKFSRFMAGHHVPRRLREKPPFTL